MADQPGAKPADAPPAATADEGEEDIKAQELLADAVATTDDGDEQLGAAGKKALQRERDARKAAEKARSDAEARIKEFEDRDKSEQQRAVERAETAEKAAKNAQREALRFRIASKHQISDEDAEAFLTGADEDAITAQAERLVALQGSGKKFKGTGDGGAAGHKSGTAQLTKADLAGMSNEQINKARKEGRLDRAMGKNA